MRKPLPRVKATPRQKRDSITLVLVSLALVVSATGAPWFVLVGITATLWVWLHALHIAEAGPRPRYRRKGTRR